MVKIQLISPQVGYLDVAEGTVFPLNFAIGDIRDPSKRSGSYSKTITLPGTKNNNNLLSYLYDINADEGTFNVKIRQKCLVIQNGVAIIDNCYLQLVSVKNIEEEIIYEVLIKNTASDFFQTINSRELTDLDFSEWNHELNSDYVNTSISSTDDFKYVLPYFEGTQITVSEALACWRVKAIFDRIFQTAGFNYQWDELETPGIRFGQLLMPYNGEGYDAREVDVVIAGDTDVDLPDVMFLTPPQVILSEIEDDQGRYDPGIGIYTSGNTFVGSDNLKATLKASGTATFTNNTGDNQLLTEIEGSNVFYNLTIIKNASTIDAVGTSILVKIPIADGQILNDGDSLTADFDISVDIPLNDILLNDQLTFIATGFIDRHLSFLNELFAPNPSEYDYSIYFDSIQVKIQPSSLNVYSGLSIFVNQYLPKKIKQSDFIKSIFQLFNIYADVDKDNANLLILKTRDLYYDTGETKDWSKKIQYAEELDIQFLPDISNKKYLLTYKSDSDETNKIYTQATNEIYGQQEYVFESEYVRETQKNELIFSPTPWSFNDNNMALSFIQGKSPKNNIRLLFEGDVQSCNPFYINDFVAEDGILRDTYYTAIHFDNPIAPSFDLNFGVCDFYYTDRNGLTNNNMFNYHWRRMLSQINNGRLLTAMFRLNELDIANLQLSDNIQIGNTLYNINKVIDYNANGNQLTKVELMTIDSELVPYQTREISQRTRANFNLSLEEKINVITNGAIVKGRNNNVQGKGIVVGDTNKSMRFGMIYGTNNYGNGVILGSNNFIPEYYKAIILGSGKEVTRDNALFADQINTPILNGNVRQTNISTYFTDFDFTIEVIADNKSVKLPDPTLDVGRIVCVKNYGAINTSVIRTFGEEIDGGTIVSLPSDFDSAIFKSDGTNWMVLSLKLNPSTPTSSFLSYVAKSSNYTITTDDYTIDCSNTITITLPTAVDIEGQVFVIKNSDTGIVTVDGDGSETIDGDETFDLYEKESITIQSTGTNWIII